MQLRVVTYNIKSCQFHQDGAEAIAGAIRRLGPQIVALQEVDRSTRRASGIDQVEELAHRTGLRHAAFGRAVDWPGGGAYGLGLLSAFPLRDVQVVYLPTPSATTVPESEREPRALLAARAETPAGELWVLTSHFGLGADQRIDQAQALLAHLAGAGHDARWVVMGDFNGEPGTPEIELLAAELTDVMLGRSFEERWTFPTDPDVQPGRRLACDYIFVRGVEPSDGARVVRNEGTASDHFPLVVDLTV